MKNSATARAMASEPTITARENGVASLAADVRQVVLTVTVVLISLISLLISTG
jgi:hypothetical protein